MKFWARLLVHTLVPPLVGSCAVGIGIWFTSNPITVDRALRMAAEVVILGYGLATIPSLLYAVTMEAWYRCGRRFGPEAAVGFSGLLGLCWGAVPLRLWIGAGYEMLVLWFALSGLQAGVVAEFLVQRRDSSGRTTRA